MALVGGEGAAVVVPERRTDQYRWCAGDRGDIGRTLGQGAIQFGVVQPAVVGMERGGRVKRQNMTARVLTLHGLAPRELPPERAASVCKKTRP